MNQLMSKYLALNRLITANCTNRRLSILNTRSFITTPSRTAEKKNPNPLTDEDIDKPIDYLQSPAAQWKAQWSTGAIRKDNSPWFEQWIVLVCLSVFLTYFCILREENDIDEQLKTPLYENVPGMEQAMLLTSFKYNLDNNKDTKEIEKRMTELGMDVARIKKEHLGV